ncbi:hypothetical protein FSP39_005120 [Pinctada imbricata]|uniref:Glucose-methanol-choline oxidoreductase N-terminal domain-containing protein n=1 Tax=Pinctada imbricata TaxID=66713 RepID=A0AA88Y383_PINIB|nr:hypothetical protein FSP39_005120 [Pinctada imbricata]
MLRSSARRSTSQYARGRSRGTPKAPAATMKACSATKRRTSTVVTTCPPETDVNPTPPKSRATLPASSPEEAPTIIQDNDVIDAMPLSPPPQSTITAAHDALADATSKGTCTLNDGVSNYAFPIQPNALVSVTDALGAHVASSLKSSIFNNEFVHLHKLIPNKANEEPQQQLTLVNGELVIKPKHKEVRINSLDSWTNAFLIYMSIYLSKFPEHAQSLLKYLHTVRTAAQRSTNLSWLDYDVQFRLKRSRNHTIQWDSVDAELWLLYVNPSSTSITNTTPAKAGKFGAGSSGAVLASRLSEDPSVSVLLVEAGGSDEWSFTIAVPLLPILLQKSKYDWAYVTESQKHACKGFKEQKSCWPRGRVLGGSSCLNYMVYVRGSRHDFDDWAANGCEGWSYKDVLPYFIKSENVQISELRRSGYCKMQLTTKNGARCSTSKAFLREAMSRPNLHVTVNSVVTKVIIENKKAVGIEIIKDGKRHVVMCNKEVILSAGAVGSPQILMLSGVGPEKHLKEHGIPVHADLPVGQNLQDHLMVPLPFFPNQSLSVTEAKASSLKSIFNWLIWGKGCWSFSGLEATAFVKTKKDASYKYPDMQLHFLSTSAEKDRVEDVVLKMNLDRKFSEAIVASEFMDKERFTILPTLLHPRSRGVIKLRSTDPLEHPLIDPNYLSEQEDVDTLVRGIKLALQISNTSTFKPYDVSDSHPNLNLPALSKYKYGSDEFWEQYVRYMSFTVYHPTSTCAMGGVNDPNAVVDPCLRVIGIENLRVADCSVMRTITSGNTNAPAIMIGEKAADLILQRDSVKDIKQRIRHILDKL